MTDKAIINASPLIILSRSGYLPLLRGLAREIWIPGQVADEIWHYGPDDITAQSIMQLPWLVQHPTQTIPPSVAALGIDEGEAAVLAMGISHPDTEVIIDDLAGRKCADALNIPLRGTVGVVLAAKKRGFISKAGPVIDDMLNKGLYLSADVINKALARAGE